MKCELCGNSSDEFYEVEIEGAKMIVCDVCSKYGKIIKRIDTDNQSNDLSPKINSGLLDIGDWELRSDYPEIIKKAMSSKSISINELSMKSGVEIVELQKILNGKIIPTEEVAHKLEKILRIKLFEQR